jgi:hypothetical protein
MDSGQDCLFGDGVSDEALELAGMGEGSAAGFTLGNCTGLTVCPAA